MTGWLNFGLTFDERRINVPSSNGKFVDSMIGLPVNGDTVTRDAPDAVFAGNPVNPKAGYRISGKDRIPDIRPDT
jgi:hypothetical protein